jgi:lexA repressor|nr:MAG TPA: Repressor protein CI [Caudoviricetes sp.]
MNFRTRLKQLRNEKKINQRELANFLKVAPSTISMYESGQREPNFEVLESLADFFNVDLNYLLGKSDKTTKLMLEDSQPTQGLQIPVLGTVAAGIPISAVEDILDYEEIDSSFQSQGEFFALRIKGDSMQPKMDDGDVVIVRQQSDANSGDTVIALVNGDDATCKKLQKTENGIMLLSTNPNYLPMFFTNEEIQTKPVVILGKVVELRSKF